MNKPGDSMGDKSLDFHSPNISFLNIPNYQKHFSQKCNFPTAINTKSQYIASLAFQRQENYRKRRHDQRQSTKQSMNINPIIHSSSKYYNEEVTDQITIFSKSSKQRELLSLFESILFKEGT